MKIKNILTEKLKDDNNDKISKDVTIYILTALLVILIIYLLASKVINERNLEMSEQFAAISTVISETTTDEPILQVNINTNNVFELTLLPGIGTNKAKAIIEYRKENGDFTDIIQLKNVTGIGESVYNKLSGHIYVSEEQSTDKSEDIQ